jgi:hypothetical protein
MAFLKYAGYRVISLGEAKVEAEFGRAAILNAYLELYGRFSPPA